MPTSTRPIQRLALMMFALAAIGAVAYAATTMAAGFTGMTAITLACCAAMNFVAFYAQVEFTTRTSNRVWSLYSATQLVILLVAGPAMAVVAAVCASIIHD